MPAVARPRKFQRNITDKMVMIMIVFGAGCFMVGRLSSGFGVARSHTSLAAPAPSSKFAPLQATAAHATDAGVYSRLEKLEKSFQEENLARVMVEGEITKERSARLKMEEHLDGERTMRLELEEELKAVMKPVRKTATTLFAKTHTSVRSDLKRTIPLT